MSADTDTHAIDDRVVFLGAGHAHLLAIPAVRRALPQARIVLVEPAPVATYSGMVPGCIAGHYRPDQAQIDLPRFAQRHRVDLVTATACGLTADAVQLTFGGQVARGGALSLDIGSHSTMAEIPGFAEHAIAVKPLATFLASITSALDRDRRRVVVIGAGVAGIELALAIAWRHACPVTVVEAGPSIVPGLAPRTRDLLHRSLAQRGVRIVAGRRVTRIGATSVTLDDDGTIAADLVIGAAGARAHAWMADHLPTDGAGFIRVAPDLRAEGTRTTFATGDCAAMIHTPRPKAGLYAVRQAPILARNLIATMQVRPLQRFDPQDDYLKLIALGPRCALGEWHGFSAHGRWVWHVKDHIDRRFVAGLKA